MKEENERRYREFLIEVNTNWNPKLERYVMLLMIFGLTYLAIPFFVIHNLMAGFKKEDQDIMNFYTPLLVMLFLLNSSLWFFVESDAFLLALSLTQLLRFLIYGLVIFDLYKTYNNEKPLTFNLIKIPESLLDRKSYMGAKIRGNI